MIQKSVRAKDLILNRGSVSRIERTYCASRKEKGESIGGGVWNGFSQFPTKNKNVWQYTVCWKEPDSKLISEWGQQFLNTPYFGVSRDHLLRDKN